MTQPLSQEEFATRTIDYLDGRLDADARAAFEAALQAHPDWADDVRALAATWQHARQALSSAQEKPPARVREHVLAEAAKRAADVRARARAAPDFRSTGVWQRVRVWLWNGPWVAPAMLAAAAVGIYVFSQSDEPLKARDQVPVITNEGRPRFAAPPSAGRLLDAEQAAPAEREAVEEAKQEESTAVSKRQTQPPAPLAGADDAIGFGSQNHKAGRAGSAALPQRRNGEVAAEATAYRRHSDAVSGVGAAEPTATRRKPVPSARARKAEQQSEGASDRRGFAQPPPAWEQPAQAADTVRAEPSLEGVPTGGAASAPAAPSAAKPAPRAAPPPPSPASAAQENIAADAQLGRARTGNHEGTSLLELSRAQLVERAQQAERERRWAVAASAYRELLRRYAADELASSWRERLAAAQAALSQGQ